MASFGTTHFQEAVYRIIDEYSTTIWPVSIYGSPAPIRIDAVPRPGAFARALHQFKNALDDWKQLALLVEDQRLQQRQPNRMKRRETPQLRVRYRPRWVRRVPNPNLRWAVMV